jgi:exosortase
MVPQGIQPESSPAVTAPARLQWATIALLSTLLLVLYAPVLSRMAYEWVTNDDMNHGLFVPAAVLFIIWERREKLLQVQLRPHWFGYLLILLGFIQLLAGTAGADMFLMRIAFLVSLLGLLVATCGFPVVRAMAFPLVLLLFMIRIPLFIYSQITLPLQLLASQLAELALQSIGIAAIREGNVLELAEHTLNVAEACSGIRSLMALLFFSLVYGYFFAPQRWMKVFLVVATVPIGIGVNAFRVTLTGIFYQYKPELAQGLLHALEGAVLTTIAGVMLVLTHQVVKRFLQKVGSGTA